MGAASADTGKDDKGDDKAKDKLEKTS